MRGFACAADPCPSKDKVRLHRYTFQLHCDVSHRRANDDELLERSSIVFRNTPLPQKWQVKPKPQIPYRHCKESQLFGALSRLLEGSNFAETLGAEQRLPEFQSFARPSCSVPPPAARLNQANASSPEESIPAGTFGVALFLAAAPLPEQQLA